MTRGGYIVLAVVAATLVVILIGRGGDDTPAGPTPTKVAPEDRPPGVVVPTDGGSCSEKLDRAALEKSLELGTSFLMNNQKEAGNFTYEYDWKNKTYTQGDSQVRQAGAAWGLGLLFLYNPDAEVQAKLDKALAFFKQHSQVGENGRWIVYPGDPDGSAGTVALVVLTHVEYLRSKSELLTAERRAELEADFDEYMKFLLSLRRDEDKLWAQRYANADGAPRGEPSPYYDGETMLGMAKAARYLGRDDLWPILIESAHAGRKKYIHNALKVDPDSKLTKGFYQWSSMTFFEITTSDQPDVETFGDTIIELADWMIDVHRTLSRSRNTAYAYEGIVHAYELARQRGQDDKATKFRCVIEQGLEKLTSWQVGHPLANKYIREVPTDDPLAVGGIQNHKKEPQQRIDVTQHQMHAVLLALKYVFKE